MSFNKFKPNDYYPKRFGIKYDPPAIGKTNKTYKFKNNLNI